MHNASCKPNSNLLTSICYSFKNQYSKILTENQAHLEKFLLGIRNQPQIFHKSEIIHIKILRINKYSRIPNLFILTIKILQSNSEGLQVLYWDIQNPVLESVISAKLEYRPNKYSSKYLQELPKLVLNLE